MKIHVHAFSRGMRFALCVLVLARLSKLWRLLCSNSCSTQSPNETAPYSTIKTYYMVTALYYIIHYLSLSRASGWNNGVTSLETVSRYWFARACMVDGLAAVSHYAHACGRARTLIARAVDWSPSVVHQPVYTGLYASMIIVVNRTSLLHTNINNNYLKSAIF